MLCDKGVIVGRVVGGLGNQLFIWAATNYYASKFNKTPKFDIQDRNKFSLNEILSNHVHTIQLPRWRLFIVNCLIRVSRRNYNTRKLANKFFGIYIQKETGVAMELEPSSSSKYLSGYFQSEKYIKSIKSLTTQQNFNLLLDTRNGLLALEKFLADGGVAIHIRLGDYLKSENEYFGILAPSYYLKSLNLLGVNSGNRVWIFSDSPGLAKKIYSKALEAEFELFWPTEQFDLSTIEEFKLLTNARKFVIANSTFSWWAAFLASDNCQTIYPTKWFKFSNDPEELMPAEWISVESVWIQHKIDK